LSTRRTPAAYTCSTNPPGSASPANATVATPAGSPSRTTSAITDGTMQRSRTSSRAASVWSPSGLSATSRRPPQASGAQISNIETSKPTEVEPKTPPSSAAVNRSWPQRRSVAVLRCSIATPFGMPVEPDV
jgi:hypothetical protein